MAENSRDSQRALPSPPNAVEEAGDLLSAQVPVQQRAEEATQEEEEEGSADVVSVEFAILQNSSKRAEAFNALHARAQALDTRIAAFTQKFHGRLCGESDAKLEAAKAEFQRLHARILVFQDAIASVDMLHSKPATPPAAHA